MQIIEEDVVDFEPLLIRFISTDQLADSTLCDAAAFVRDWFDQESNANSLEWSVAKEWTATVEKDGSISARCELIPANALPKLAEDFGRSFPAFTEMRVGIKVESPATQAEFDWVHIPTGVVTVGGQQQSVPEFDIAFTAVTLGQFTEFLEKTQYVPVPDKIEKDDGYLLDHFTLNYGKSLKQVLLGITYDDAMAYCEWAGYRLPNDYELARFFEWAVREGRRFECAGECWTSTQAGEDEFFARNGPYVPETLNWPESRHRKTLHRHQYEHLEAPCFRVVRNR